MQCKPFTPHFEKNKNTTYFNSATKRSRGTRRNSSCKQESCVHDIRRTPRAIFLHAREDCFRFARHSTHVRTCRGSSQAPYDTPKTATTVDAMPAKTPATSKKRCNTACPGVSSFPNKRRWNKIGYTRARGTAQTPPTMPTKLSNRFPATCPGSGSSRSSSSRSSRSIPSSRQQQQQNQQNQHSKQPATATTTKSQTEAATAESSGSRKYRK